MEIYIEYAFLENFFFDFLLLWLSQRSAKMPVSKFRLLLSATVGAFFALAFPFIRLADGWRTLAKISCGVLLPLLCCKRAKTRKEWGRCALTCFFFLLWSFGFGGGIIGFYGMFSGDGEAFSLRRMPFGRVLIGFACGLPFVWWLLRSWYARRRRVADLYECRVRFAEEDFHATGFFDSGNRAEKDGVPVCFVSPDVAFRFWNARLLQKGEGQVCDEMEIHTVSGSAVVPLYAAELSVFADRKWRKSRVYFAPSRHIVSKEYTILLNARLLEGVGEDEV